MEDKKLLALASVYLEQSKGFQKEAVWLSGGLRGLQMAMRAGRLGQKAVQLGRGGRLAYNVGRGIGATGRLAGTAARAGKSGYGAIGRAGKALKTKAVSKFPKMPDTWKINDFVDSKGVIFQPNRFGPNAALYYDDVAKGILKPEFLKTMKGLGKHFKYIDKRMGKAMAKQQGQLLKETLKSQKFFDGVNGILAAKAVKPLTPKGRSGLSVLLSIAPLAFMFGAAIVPAVSPVKKEMLKEIEQKYGENKEGMDDVVTTLMKFSRALKDSSFATRPTAKGAIKSIDAVVQKMNSFPAFDPESVASVQAASTALGKIESGINESLTALELLKEDVPEIAEASDAIIDTLIQVAIQMEAQKGMTAQADIDYGGGIIKEAIDPLTAFTIVSTVAWGVSELVDYLQETSNIPDDVDLILTNLSSYKGQKGFGQHAPFFTSFINNLTELKDKYNNLEKLAKEKDVDTIIDGVNGFFELAQTLEEQSEEANTVLKSFKDVGDITGDVLGFLGMNLGIDTDIGAAQKGIEALFNHLQTELPQMEERFQKVITKAEEMEMVAPTPGKTVYKGFEGVEFKTEEDFDEAGNLIEKTEVETDPDNLEPFAAII